MNFIDKIVIKYGYDKTIHFLSGSLISAIVTIIVAFQEFGSGIEIWRLPLISLMGVIVTVFLAWMKELAIDASFNKKDILATVLGCIPIVLASGIGALFCLLSN